MPAINQTVEPTNITLRQNQIWDITFSLCINQDPSQPIPVTGYVPLLQLRTSALAKTSVLSLTNGNGLTFNPTTCPQVQVSAKMAVNPGKYEWDLVLYYPNTDFGNIFLGAGIIQVNAEVSRV
jgi:hypothetical protein